MKFTSLALLIALTQALVTRTTKDEAGEKDNKKVLEPEGVHYLLPNAYQDMVNNANPDMPTFPMTEGRYGARTAFYAQQESQSEDQELVEEDDDESE